MLTVCGSLLMASFSSLLHCDSSWHDVMKFHWIVSSMKFCIYWRVICSISLIKLWSQVLKFLLRWWFLFHCWYNISETVELLNPTLIKKFVTVCSLISLMAARVNKTAFSTVEAGCQKHFCYLLYQSVKSRASKAWQGNRSWKF